MEYLSYACILLNNYFITLNIVIESWNKWMTRSSNKVWSRNAPWTSAFRARDTRVWNIHVYVYVPPSFKHPERWCLAMRFLHQVVYTPCAQSAHKYRRVVGWSNTRENTLRGRCSARHWPPCANMAEYIYICAIPFSLDCAIYVYHSCMLHNTRLLFTPSCLQLYEPEVDSFRVYGWHGVHSTFGQ